MPSTHSAIMGYYVCYIFLSYLYLPLHRSVLPGPALGMVFTVIVLPSTILILLSRVWLGHHTWPQVAVGSMYGIVFALGWFMMWFKGVDEYGQYLEARWEARVGFASVPLST